MADFGASLSNPVQPPSLLPDLSSLASIGSGLNVNHIPKRNLPWNSSESTVNSRFFQFVDIDPMRWDELYPYRLMVIDATDNRIINGGSVPLLTVTKGTGVATVTFQPINSPWMLSLPITPQQLNITDQYAINTSATLRGVLEEHSGVRFKMINAAGSLGVWPYRQSIVEPPQSPSILQSLFGGTIAAATNVADQFQKIVNTATNNNPNSKPVSKRPTDLSTGYFFAMALQQFLEQYAEAKKDPKNAKWRLVFDIPKQKQSFVVTPMQFTWQQNASKPMEISYALQFKAWRRVKIGEPQGRLTASNQSLDTNTLQKILGAISQSRQLMSASLNLIGAVRSDVNTPLDVLRQTSLFVKGYVGAAVTVADLPFQIQSDYTSAIHTALNTISGSIASTSTDPDVRNAITGIKNTSAKNEGLSMSAVASGQLGSIAANSQSINPDNNVFKNPAANFSLMDQANISSLGLTDAQQTNVSNIVNDARNITVDDLKTFRSTILGLSLQLSNSFGAGDAFFSKIYNKPAPTPRIQPITLDEYDILKTLYDSIQSYDILTATTDLDDLNKTTNMEYVAGLASTSNIPFSISQSKILVPVPFGLTMEAIAARYLGDPQRWLEIATLNNLRDPYIDEDGFTLNLLSNATGRQITISSINNLYIGQRVLLSSATQSPSARTILGIDRLSDTDYLLTLDGLPNLNNYLLADLAYLQAYLPGTVNSQQKIFVPSNIPITPTSSIVPPSVTSNDPLTGLSKVDLLLTESGDIAVNSYGDFRYAYGMTNIIQALRIKFSTMKGKWLLHPGFGLGIFPGTSVADISAQETFDSIDQLVKQDPRFQGISGLQISINGPTLSISLGISIAGQQGVFPLTFDL